MDAAVRGANAEGQTRMRASLLAAKQTVGLGKAGVAVGEGSALRLAGDTAMMGEMDALTVRNNAIREAYGFKVDAASARYQKSMVDYSMPFTLAGGVLSMAGSAASAASMYKSLKYQDQLLNAGRAV